VPSRSSFAARARVHTHTHTQIHAHTHTRTHAHTETYTHTLSNTIRTHAGTCRKEHAHTHRIQHARQSQRHYTRREQRCHVFSHLCKTLPKMDHWLRMKISTHRHTHTLYSVLNLQIHAWIHTSLHHTQWHRTMPLSLIGSRERACFCPLGWSAWDTRNGASKRDLAKNDNARKAAYACNRVLPLWALRHSSRAWRWAASRRPSFETSCLKRWMVLDQLSAPYFGNI